ncbi:hypothetical protein EJ02DRAFT_359300, partial [Clathrospora elynae]
IHTDMEAQVACRYYHWQWQRFLLFTRQQTVQVSQQWQHATHETQCQVVERVNAALMYERIHQAPEEVIHWRMTKLLEVGGSPH